jgi:hypothetical protein
LVHPVQLGRALQLLTSSSPNAARKGTIDGFSDLPINPPSHINDEPEIEVLCRDKAPPMRLYWRSITNSIPERRKDE